MDQGRGLRDTNELLGHLLHSPVTLSYLAVSKCGWKHSIISSIVLHTIPGRVAATTYAATASPWTLQLQFVPLSKTCQASSPPSVRYAVGLLSDLFAGKESLKIPMPRVWRSRNGCANDCRETSTARLLPPPKPGVSCLVS